MQRMFSLIPSCCSLRHCTLVVHYVSFHALHPFMQPFSTDKRTLRVRCIHSILSGEPTRHLPLQYSTPRFSSSFSGLMENKQHTVDHSCIADLDNKNYPISVSPSRTNPSESHSFSSRAKGKTREFNYEKEEEKEDGGEHSGRGKHNGKGAGKNDKIDSLGRLLTTILRHRAVKLDLDIRSDGYVPVDRLLTLKEKTFAGLPLCSHTVDNVKEAVMNDNKQRFSLLEENGILYIRANQGHTLKVIESERLLTPILSAEQVPVCVHGTYKKNLESILKNGLSRMKRNHVHFATGLLHDGDVISGMRRDINILIFLDVEKALKDKMQLYLSDNKVLLTEGFGGIVPSQYFAKMETWPEREPILLP